MGLAPAMGGYEETPQAFLVEHYWPEATPDAFQAMTARVRAAVDDMAGSGAPLRFLHSTFVPAEGSALCVFSSPLPALVQEAYRRAGVSFDRVVAAVEAN
jgi:hypothetical protein